jgi:uncharacterized protein (TIGR02147 family)
MNVFEEMDYRRIFRRTVEELKELDPKMNFQSLAEAMRIQHSYLSKVLKETAELSADQMYLACQHLKFTAAQSEYLMLLLEYSRCGLKSRQDDLLKMIRGIQKQHLETKEHLDKTTLLPQDAGGMAYYLDPLNQVVHICLSLPRYQRDLALLARDLEVRPSRLNGIIQFLEGAGIVHRKDGRTLPKTTNFHLDRNSAVYPFWRTQTRLQALERMKNLPNEESYNFSVVFSATPKTREKVQQEIFALLKKVEGEVKEADPEEVYQFTIDLFSWTHS